MLMPMKVPQGGFNQELRQHPKVPGGYIYSHTGDNYNDYITYIYPLLPDRVSFSEHAQASDLQKDSPGTNSIPQTAVIFPYPGTPPAGMPWRITLLAGKRTIDCTLIARILSVQPVSQEDGSTDSSSTWQKGLIERRTETTLLAPGTLTELVGDQGDRYALVASFSDSTTELPPPPPGYHYESQSLTEDFTLTCRQFAHILIISGYNFQRYERGNTID
ncbi:MAG: hypothetical protein WCC64_21005 [Aliidongia sp.]